MGGVTSFVEDTFDSVGDAVGDVTDSAFDLVDQVVEPVMTEIVEPVANVATKVVDNAMEDPIGTAAMVGTAIFAPELLPAVNGAMALSKGASLEQAVTVSALSYAGQTAGQFVGAETSAALEDSIGKASASTVGKVAGSATSTAVRGGDVEQALTGGILNATAGAGVNEAMKAAGVGELDPWQQRAVGTVVSSGITGRNPIVPLTDQLITGGINTATGAGTSDASTLNFGDTQLTAKPLQTTLPLVPNQPAPTPAPRTVFRPAPNTAAQKTGIASLDTDPFGGFSGFDPTIPT
jgi:hypothetical protein